jgi:hypothetical protein
MVPWRTELQGQSQLRSQLLLTLLGGLLPYLGGLLVIATRSIQWLAFAGALICVLWTSLAYHMRKYRDPVSAKQILLVDPMLYGFEFVFTAVVIRFVFKR